MNRTSRLVLAVVLTSAGCAGSTTRWEPARPARVAFLPAPPGREVIVEAWLPDRSRFLVEVAPRNLNADGESHLYMMRANGRDLRPVPGTREGGCPATAEDGATMLDGRRIAYWSICFRSRRGDRRMRSLRVADLGSGASSRYVERFFRLFEAGGFAFSPATGRGVLSLGDRLSNRLYWLRRSGLAPVRDVPLVNAGPPAWSSDGTWIAVSGVPASEGRDSPLRESVRWSLNVMDSTGRRFRTLVDDLTDTAAASWSPDSRWLAVAMSPADGPRGVWLVRHATGERRLLLRGAQYGRPTWLPDGRRLAVPVTGRPYLGHHRYGTLLVTLRASTLG